MARTHNPQSPTDSEHPANSGSSVKRFYEDRRGQTFFDFIIGISLFLLVVMFTVFFIPDLIDPFEPSQDASTVLADRGADHLTQNVMRADGEGPYVLDRECTIALFDGVASDKCDVEHDELWLIVGMADGSNVHAELVNRQGDVVEIDGVEMSVGNDVETTASGDVYSATRIVTIDGDRYEFSYTVW